jgi:hypothetical protein
MNGLAVQLVYAADEMGDMRSARGSPLRVGQHAARHPDARGWYADVRWPAAEGA